MIVELDRDTTLYADGNIVEVRQRIPCIWVQSSCMACGPRSFSGIKTLRIPFSMASR